MYPRTHIRTPIWEPPVYYLRNTFGETLSQTKLPVSTKYNGKTNIFTTLLRAYKRNTSHPTMTSSPLPEVYLLLGTKSYIRAQSKTSTNIINYLITTSTLCLSQILKVSLVRKESNNYYLSSSIRKMNALYPGFEKGLLLIAYSLLMAWFFFSQLFYFTNMRLKSIVKLAMLDSW